MINKLNNFTDDVFNITLDKQEHINESNNKDLRSNRLDSIMKSQISQISNE